VVSTLLVTALELLSLLVLHQLGSTLNVIPSGPVGLAFSLVYQFFRLVPSTYHFRVFGVAFSNKAFLYALASQVNNRQTLNEPYPHLRSARVQSVMVHCARRDTRVFCWRAVSIRYRQSEKLPASSLVCPAELPLYLTHW
jgi:hypothetical protein